MKLKGLKRGLFLKNQDMLSKSFFSLVAPVSPPHITDIDGNIYTYVRIGTQEWLVENLRTVTYADGTPIPNLILGADWIAEDGSLGHDGAYCVYDNDPLNIPDYGLLYNWYAVDNAHGLAPTGWRVASDTDWDTLVAYLGGGSVAGGKLKEIGLSHWAVPNTGATDEYGFKALPGGLRHVSTGGFSEIGDTNWLWTSSILGGNAKWKSLTYAGASIIGSDAGKAYGFSVRCMRDI